MELVSSRDEFPFLISVHPLSYLLFPISSLLSHPLSSLLSPMWQKLPYICNNFFYYNNLSITFLNYCTIEKSPRWPRAHVTTPFFSINCHALSSSPTPETPQLHRETLSFRRTARSRLQPHIPTGA